VPFEVAAAADLGGSAVALGADEKPRRSDVAMKTGPTDPPVLVIVKTWRTTSPAWGAAGSTTPREVVKSGCAKAASEQAARTAHARISRWNMGISLCNGRGPAFVALEPAAVQRHMVDEAAHLPHDQPEDHQ
jgi:hypothetical protein